MSPSKSSWSNDLKIIHGIFHEHFNIFLLSFEREEEKEGKGRRKEGKKGRGEGEGGERERKKGGERERKCLPLFVHSPNAHNS